MQGNKTRQGKVHPAIVGIIIFAVFVISHWRIGF